MKYTEAPTNLLERRLSRLLINSKEAVAQAMSETKNPVFYNVLKDYKAQPLEPSFDDTVKKTVWYYNSAKLVWDSFPDYENMSELESVFDQILTVSEILLDRMKPEGLQLRWFTCPECGHEIQMYTYSDIEDTRLSTGNEKDKNSNPAFVYEFMHMSHLCADCWYKFIVKGE